MSLYYYAMRLSVREQIQTMFRDGILEELYTAYISPISLVHLEKKAKIICPNA